jgi:hypothetical protein
LHGSQQYPWRTFFLFLYAWGISSSLYDILRSAGLLPSLGVRRSVGVELRALLCVLEQCDSRESSAMVESKHSEGKLVNSLEDSMRNSEAIRNENSRDTNTGKLMVLKVLELSKESISAEKDSYTLRTILTAYYVVT